MQRADSRQRLPRLHIPAVLARSGLAFLNGKGPTLTAQRATGRRARCGSPSISKSNEKGRHLDDAPVGRIALVRGRAHRDTARVSHHLLVRKRKDLRRDVPTNGSSASYLLASRASILREPRATASASIRNVSSLPVRVFGRGRLQLTPRRRPLDFDLAMRLGYWLEHFFGAFACGRNRFGVGNVPYYALAPRPPFTTRNSGKGALVELII